jgi:hypothetical protein
MNVEVVVISALIISTTLCVLRVLCVLCMYVVVVIFPLIIAATGHRCGGCGCHSSPHLQRDWS